MHKPRNLTGQTFGYLTVLGPAPRILNGTQWRTAWGCQCTCGTIVIVTTWKLTSKHTQSCGCYMRERATVANTTHGGTWRGNKDPEYESWCKMKRRCITPTDHRFPLYGGRGIAVCEEWRRSYAAFRAHIGPRPGLDYTVDRIDNDKGYEPGNVRWATSKQQNNNRRNNRLVTLDGVTKTLAQWSDSTRISYTVLVARLRAGWIPERAFTEPVRKIAKRHAIP